MNTPKLLCLMIASLPLAARAADGEAADRIEVLGARLSHLEAAALGTSDTARSLADQPGYSVNAAGGVSALPALRGLADDRIKILLDGAESTAACGNHMNAPLSYVSPGQVGSVRVIPGLSPVSLGGDNIAGVIAIQSAAPIFATGEAPLAGGALTLQSRSVDHGLAASASASLAGERLSIAYSGATSRADSYRDGNGDKVLDTLYKATNHALTLAARAGDGIWTLKLGGQDIPYQGFANQYMDMTRNRSAFGNLGYAGGFGWGRLDARAYWQKVKHEMGFFSDERMGMMPMSTEGRNEGYRVQAELPAAEGVLRLGHELHRTRLDDWWPAAPGSMMMEPDPYLNINGGRRDRLAFFGEWEGKLADRWSGTFGLRHESVRMDTGTVQSYGCGMMCAEDDAAAAAFNAADRGRRDRNLDLTLVARHQVDDTFGYEFGAAQKTRSPNLYERYSWGRGTMAMAMIGWFGDGNGYVGNPDLAPEVARTLSATADWRAADPRGWQFSATPFYTKVRDYIDADRLGTFSPVAGSTKALLRFANHDATLYGLNLAWQAQAWSSGAWGTGTLKGKIDWTRGKRDDGGDLYHVMPLNALVALAHSQGAWSGELQLELVARKSRVDERRAEDVTAGYGLVNLQGRYAIAKPVELMLGVRNLFDRRYDLPLGGVNLAEAGASGRGLGPLAGQGRSVDVGVVVKF